MKKAVFAITLLMITSLLCGCFAGITPILDEESLGSPKTFEKDGLTITLTDAFEEQESERGFDAYYVAGFGGVVVLKEEFTLEEGLAERPLEEYIVNVIENNGYTDITPQNEDGLWYYDRVSDTSYGRSYCYKGSDAFYIVQFICKPYNEEKLGDKFHSWALSVEVE